MINTLDINVNPLNLLHGHSIYFSWDEVIKWAFDFHMHTSSFVTALNNGLEYAPEYDNKMIVEKLEYVNLPGQLA